MVLLGMVPVLMQHPPMASIFSTNATCLPNFAPWMAARCPAGPEPITIRSKVCMSEVLIVRHSPAGYAASAGERPSRPPAHRRLMELRSGRMKFPRANLDPRVHYHDFVT